MSPRTRTRAPRGGRPGAIVVAAATIALSATAVATAAADTTTPSTATPATTVAPGSLSATTPAEISRVLTTGSPAEVVAMLRRLGLGPMLATRDTTTDAGLSSFLAALESFRQTLAPTKLPVIGSTVDEVLRVVIDSLATNAGIPSPTTDSVLEAPGPVSVIPGVAESNGPSPATPVPVAKPFVARATVQRVRTTSSRKRLRITARCPTSSSIACETTVTGTLGGRRAFASRRLTIDPGATQEATVALSASTSKALARSSATLRVTTTTKGATPGAVTRTIRVPRTR